MINKPESCRPCPLWGSGRGFVPSSGSGSNGVLIVLEAPGPDEESKATQAVGKASQFLFSKLKQVGIERDDFAIHSAISCAPPFGKFEGESFEADALTHCHEHLERTILSHIEAARSRKQQPVILTFGDVAFRRVMQIGRDDSMMKGYFTYPHLGPHGETVIGTRSTGFIIKGNQHLVPMIQFATQRAIEIAASGAHPVKWDENSDFLCDPSPTMFAAWVKAYEQALEADPSIFLAFDIETPFKSGADEEEVSREEDHDYTILRCSFAYGSDDQNIQTVSIPWSAAYLPQLRHLFSIDSNKVGWNSDNYDIPRIAKQMPLQGTYLDGMLAWHVLNSALPKGLGFVAPFYNHDLAQWKHLSADKPAIYNALDSFVTLRCWLGIQKDLKRSNLWNVFERHVMKLNKVLNYMRDKGVILDEAARNEAERRVKDVQDETNKKIQIAAEPVKIYKIYKRTPPDTTGMVQKPDIVKTKQCPNCQEIDVLMGHYKSIGKKRLKDGEAENPCHGFKSDTVQVKKMLWAKPLEFKLSAKALTRYAQLNNHRTITNPKTKAITFDKEAIMSLNLIYPDDPLYTQIGKFREAQKLHSTYIGKTDTYGNIRGGIRPHSDGRIHALFSHNPSTLRLACQNPNLQNLPRPGGKDDLATLVRHMVRAQDGHVLAGSDFSGIEAVLVGYEAQSPEYIRLAKMDVHSFYTAYCLYETTDKLSAADLPQLSWSDEKLKEHLAGIKAEFKWDRNTLYKHLVHAINFGQESRGAQAKIFRETGNKPPIATLNQVMNIYRELFPAIPKWQDAVRLKADKEGYLTNAFGYVHRFNRVYDWVKRGGQWESKLGLDASRVLAFFPQSNAAGILKEATLRLFYDHFESAGQYLRLVIHDEIFLEIPCNKVADVLELVQIEMERPIPELPIPPEWGMGPYLSIDTETKVGFRWSEME